MRRSQSNRKPSSPPCAAFSVADRSDVLEQRVATTMPCLEENVARSCMANQRVIASLGAAMSGRILKRRDDKLTLLDEAFALGDALSIPDPPS
jgi:hypothetical protein